MLCKRLVIITILWAYVPCFAFAADCAASPAKRINIDSWSTRSLSSPDRRWRFTSVGPKSSEREAALYIQNTDSSQKWNVGSIERDGTVFWSEDSKRLFLRDEYAADDTNIRVFDVTGPMPKEVKGIDRRIREAVFSHVPANETTLWLYYPRVCFKAGDSSTVIVVADAPLVPMSESGPGKPFGLKLSLNVITLQIVSEGQ